jgi:hypothetical protein
MALWQWLLIIVPSTVLLCVVGGVIIGKHQVKKAQEGYKPILSLKERIIYFASFALGAGCVLFAVFFQFPGSEAVAGDPMMNPGMEGGMGRGEVAAFNPEGEVVVDLPEGAVVDNPSTNAAVDEVTDEAADGNADPAEGDAESEAEATDEAVEAEVGVEVEAVQPATPAPAARPRIVEYRGG